MDRPELWKRTPASWFLLPLLVAAWLLPRLFAPLAEPGPAVNRAVEAVRAGPSVASGRLEVHGLPSPGDDPAGLLSHPDILAARARLQTEVAAENEALSLRAADVARRLEPADGDLVGLRLSGWLIPFYGLHAEMLRDLGDRAVDRPWEALRELAVTLESRLEEPPEGVNMEISGQRRDLTRMFRNIDDALRAGESSVTQAVETFRADVRISTQAAAGPFRRRGRGFLLEIAMASLLGATLHEAIRRSRAPGQMIRLSFAPALSIAVVLTLTGTAVLPVDPLRGVSLAFLPLSFALGFATGGLLRVVSRLDRLFRDEADDAPSLATHSPGPAARPAGRTSDEPRPRPVPGRNHVRELAQEVLRNPEERTAPPPAPRCDSLTERARTAANSRGEPEPRPEAERPSTGPAPARSERELVEEPRTLREPERLPFARRRRS